MTHFGVAAPRSILAFGGVYFCCFIVFLLSGDPVVLFGVAAPHSILAFGVVEFYCFIAFWVSRRPVAHFGVAAMVVYGRIL